MGTTSVEQTEVLGGLRPQRIPMSSVDVMIGGLGVPKAGALRSPHWVGTPMRGAA